MPLLDGSASEKPKASNRWSLKLPKMMPSPEPQDAGKTGRLLIEIVAVLSFADQEGRIAQPEIKAMTVLDFRMLRTGPRRITVEQGDQEVHIFDRLEGEPHAGRRERIGRAPARQVELGDCWPVRVDEQVRIPRDVELVVRRQLADSDGCLVVP